MPEAKKDIIHRLQQEILVLQGFKVPAADSAGSVGLGEIETAFPNHIFPTGAVHEFIGDSPEGTAACEGFIAGILKALQKNRACLWTGVSRKAFPQALTAFNVEPEKIVFADVSTEKEVLWIAEEALKCKELSAVIGEVRELNFAQSRRLQLAVEKSGVTGFFIRTDIRKINATACVARWKITPLPSEPEKGMPGVGFPRWNVELLKVKNGNPGIWTVEWKDGKFTPIIEPDVPIEIPIRKLKAG